ncbi:enolase-binding protein-like [Toxorhynchites rutilus septentrionalis]|uniref:enolase-binding protein-like n=1 Tax=Toxorhynchites rutilus septentrionalis TaxID=329112 RepID=UPI0024783CAE|nr:enolase-binding protein-like [Toxorhynchites rutilus septentrionalis]
MRLNAQLCTVVGFLIAFGSGCVFGSNIFAGSQPEVDVKSFLTGNCDSNSTLMGIAVKSLSVDHIDRNVQNLCKEGAHGLLLWITADKFQQLPELDTSLKFVAKAANKEDLSGICVYDPTTDTCANENGELKGSVLILGEKYAERYELRDITYKKWTNSTRLGTPVLAYATLKNRDASYKYVDQDISYLSDSRLEHQLPATVAHGLPLSVYRGKLVRYKTVTGETFYSRVFQTINAIRYMSPYTTINVTVIATEEREYREFQAKLVTVYTDEEGYSWSRVMTTIEGASIDTSLKDTHVEYGEVTNMYDESQPAPSPNLPHTDHKYPMQPIVTKSESIHIHIKEVELGQVYPGFRSFAIGAGIILFSVLGIALLDIARRVIGDRRAKRLRLGRYSKVDGR